MAAVYKNFIYIEERNFVFAYVPKVACTNWKAILRHIAGMDDWLNPALAHDRANSGLRFLDPTGPDMGILKNPGIKKFTMVRNPFTRALSAYLNKIESRLNKPLVNGERDSFDEIVSAIDRYRKEALGIDRYPLITFEVFLRWLLNKENFLPPMLSLRVNEHWAPQVDILMWPEIKFDIIGHFENLADDSAMILKGMGSSLRFPSQSDVKFAPTGASLKVESYFSPAIVDLILEWSSKDFTAFGYSNHLPRK